MSSETTPLTSIGMTQDAEAGGEPAPAPHLPNFYQRVKDALEKSSGPFDFLKAFLLLLVETVGFLIFVGILLAIPIAMIVVGVLNMTDCPVQRFIPIWLIVSGAVFAFIQVVYILKTGVLLSLPNRPDNDSVGKCYSFFNLLLSLFSFGWFSAGNVWVFTAYPPNITDSSDGEYCEAGVYYFSFAMIIAGYAWMLLTVCCSGCVAIIGIKELAHKVSNKVTTTMGGNPSTAPAAEGDQ